MDKIFNVFNALEFRPIHLFVCLFFTRYYIHIRKYIYLYKKRKISQIRNHILICMMSKYYHDPVKLNRM